MMILKAPTRPTTYFHYSKAAWRSWAKAHYISHSEMRCAAQTQAATQAMLNAQLEALVQANPQWQTLCLYSPTRFEPSLFPALGALQQARPDLRVYFPRMQPGFGLSWHAPPNGELAAPQHWVPAPRLNFMEPHERLPVLATPPDAVVLPCLMLDAVGLRLGYGGGYYDRQLALWRGVAQPPVTVGVLADVACWVPHLPREAHDVPLHAALLPGGVHVFK